MSAAAKNRPPALVDERRVVSAIAHVCSLDVLTVGELVEYCERRCREAGLTVTRTRTPRRNERGEQIGPDLEIDLRLVDILYAVSGAIETAREEALASAVAQALGGQPVQRERTARHTWRDLVAKSGTRRDLPDLLDLTPSEVHDLSTSLGRRVDAAPNTGGLLMWNRTADDEGGHLAMITGQTAEQEQQVLANAGWLVSCGAVYSIERLGSRKRKPDTQFQLDAENRMWVWLLPNDSDVPGMIR